MSKPKIRLRHHNVSDFAVFSVKKHVILCQALTDLRQTFAWVIRIKCININRIPLVGCCTFWRSRHFNLAVRKTSTQRWKIGRKVFRCHFTVNSKPFRLLPFACINLNSKHKCAFACISWSLRWRQHQRHIGSIHSYISQWKVYRVKFH